MREIKAKIAANGNIKLGSNMGSFSTLMGDNVYDVVINGEHVKVAGTCGNNCKGCKKDCYVRKSYRYPNVILGHAYNTIAIRNTEKAYHDLDGQLTRKRKKFEVVRIDQSGEIENALQFMMWVKLAINHQETHFYIYSKCYDVIIPILLSGIVPDNMTVLISIWHQYGIDAYNQVKHLNNVKAYVYDDNDWEYTEITIQTYCKAYDENGKLDHEITCERCRKCFNRLSNCKVIGCKKH